MGAGAALVTALAVEHIAGNAWGFFTFGAMIFLLCLTGREP